MPKELYLCNYSLRDKSQKQDMTSQTHLQKTDVLSVLRAYRGKLECFGECIRRSSEPKHISMQQSNCLCSYFVRNSLRMPHS
ncbi:hypothetical protein TNCV_3957731 [Trichonephila clavipes]|nr:hypothetical protein TNCV_3957731 [Trichonephila clavipes]